MSWLYQPLLMLIARSVQSDLAHQITYLKAENAILRRGRIAAGNCDAAGKGKEASEPQARSYLFRHACRACVSSLY